MATSSISDVKALKETQIGPTNVTENERLHDSLWLSEKWQGTAADQHDMATLGRVQELRRNFQLLPTVGFACSLIATWEIFPVTLLIVLVNGGTAGLIWGYLLTCLGLMLVYLSIAEMASMAPTSGGQYHWVSELAPRSCQKYLSYLTGWMCFAGWQGAIAAMAFWAGTMVQGLLVLNYPEYTFQRWHGTLLTVAFSVFSVLFNTFLASKLPLLEVVILVLHTLGLFAIVIPLLVLAPKSSAKAVFTEFTIGEGWSSTGTAFMIGLLTPMASMIGFDCIVHMSEEVNDASRTLPKAMMWSVSVNAILGWVMVLTICCTLGDVASIATSPTGYPFIQLFYNATQNYSGANTMVAVVIIQITCSCIAQMTTASRQLWSFSRDKGIPFHTSLARVHSTWNIPLNAIVLSLVVTILLSLVNVGSTTAFNAIISLAVVTLLTSYLITIACLLLKRIRGETLPKRRWSLGRYGGVINAAALCFLIAVYPFSFFPPITPVDEVTMNYAIVMYGGIIIVATVYYVAIGRFHYTPPVLLTKRDL